MGPYCKIITAMLVWSTWGLMIRWIGQPPVVVLFATSLVAAVTVPLVLKVRGELDLTGIRPLWWLFGALALSSITNNITYFYALGHTTVSNAVFTHYTAPVIVAVLAPVLIAERIRRMTLISLPLAVSGMLLILLASGGLQLDGMHAAGILAGTASGVAYAFLIIISRKLSRMLMHHKAIIVLLWTTVAATAPFALTSELRLTKGTLLLLLMTGLMHSTVAPLLYYSALRKVMAQHAAILGYVEPLAAVPLAFFFLSEMPSFTALFGGSLIILSGYLVVHDATRPVAPEK